MSGEKYIGLDFHQATISVAVGDSQGKLIMESILETKASTILEFLAGLRGTLSLTFEEGTWAAWLYDLLAACGQVGSVQSAQERAPQTGQQKRQDRCSPTRRSVTPQ
jgi:hypothetical protein